MDENAQIKGVRKTLSSFWNIIEYTCTHFTITNYEYSHSINIYCYLQFVSPCLSLRSLPRKVKNVDPRPIKMIRVAQTKSLIEALPELRYCKKTQLNENMKTISHIANNDKSESATRNSQLEWQ